MPKQQAYRPQVGPAPWVVPAYYIICCVFILQGAFDLLSGLGVFGSKAASPVSLVVGAATILFAIGMMLKVDLIRGIANILLWLMIAGGLLSLWGAILLVPILGVFGVIMMVMCVVRIALAGFMIFLIGETDSAPNF